MTKNFELSMSAPLESFVPLLEEVRNHSSRYVNAFRADILSSASSELHSKYYERARQNSRLEIADHSALINYLALSVFRDGIDETIRLPDRLDLNAFGGVFRKLLKAQIETELEHSREAAIEWKNLRLRFNSTVTGGATGARGTRGLPEECDFYCLQVHTHPSLPGVHKRDMIHFSRDDLFTLECNILGGCIVLGEAGGLVGIKRAGAVSPHTARETLDILNGVETEISEKTWLSPGEQFWQKTLRNCDLLNYDLFVFRDHENPIAERVSLEF